MLDTESQRAKDLAIIAADYDKLPRLSRFVVWLVVILIKQRAHKPFHKTNFVVGGVVKFFDQ